MVSILEIIEASRHDLIAGEAMMSRQMVVAYQAVFQEIERQVRIFTPQIEDALALGNDAAAEAWLRQQDWYQRLLVNVEAQIDRFSENATNILAAGQVNSLGIANDASREIRSLAGLGDGLDASVNARAFERWVSVLQRGSPLRKSIERYGDDATTSVALRMTEGFGTGQGVKSIVRNIRNDIGKGSATEYQLTTLVRTERMRSFRGAFRDDMEEMSDVMSGWEWVAAKSERTCPACLGMDGQRFPQNAYPDRFHVSCRCVIRPLVDESIVPGANGPRKTGQEWLAEQPEDVQRKVLRSKTAYEAFKGGLPLRDMVGVRSNPIWGDSVHTLPVREIRNRLDARGVVTEAQSRAPFSRLGAGLPMLSPASVAPTPDARIEQLQTLYDDPQHGPVQITEIHPAVSQRWPERSVEPIVALRSQWRHVRDDHPNVDPSDVINAIENPDRIRGDKTYTGIGKKPLRVIYYQDRPDGSALVAVVEVRNGKLQNQLRTSFYMHPTEVERRRQYEELIWGEE